MANPTGGDRTASDGDTTPSRQSVGIGTPVDIQSLLDDQRQSWRRGQRTRVEDYLQWIPQLAADPAAIVELLVGEFRLQQELGESPRRADLEIRFPDLVGRLQRRLTAAGLDAPHCDSATDAQPFIAADGTAINETTSEGSTQVSETDGSNFTINDPTEHGDTGSEQPATSLIEASEALARELAERQASGRAGSPDRSTIVQLLKAALKTAPLSRSKRRPPPPLQSVAGYDLLAELGRGSVGVVYKARQAGLNRVVALKMILAGAHASRTTLARFRAEAEAVASLQHGNIVQIYEIGECDGLPFFSLEFCAGGSLADRLQGAPLPPDVAARIIVKLARAMHYAHGCKVVHRDLKPGNILLHPKDDSGRPAESTANDHEFDLDSVILKISDFGLAKRLDEESQTKTGAILGTPSYMAPEQAAGLIHDVGPSADIYSLGAMLYELLTGRPPFRAATPLDTVVQVVNDEPVPPRRLQSGVPADLETLTLKCLQKVPHKRYASALDLADDLQRFLDGEPIVARPIAIGERCWRWCRRNPLVAGLTALAAALLVAGTAISLFFAQQATERAHQAEFNEQRAKAEREGARRNQYVAEMNLLERAWHEGEMARVRALLRAQVPNSDADSDFRGPEWHYWNRLAHAELAVFSTQLGESPCLALSADGLTVAGGGAGQTIVVWNRADGRELARLTGHSDSIVGLAFLNDGRLVSASTCRGIGDRGPFVQGAEVRIWSVAEKRQLEAHFIRGDAEIEKCAVSADATRIAIADRSGAVTVARLKDGSKIHEFDGDGTSALSVAFSPDGRRVAAGFANGDALVWSLESGAVWKSYRRPRSVAHCIAFSPEGRRLAIGGSDLDEHDAGFRRQGSVRIISLESDSVLAEFQRHSGPVLHADFSRDGQRVISGGNDRTIRIWDAIDGTELSVHHGHERATTAAVFDSVGRTAMSAGDDDAIRVWDADARFDPWPMTAELRLSAALAIRPDGRSTAIATWRDNGTPWIVFQQLPSQKKFSEWPSKVNLPVSMAWHPTQSWLASLFSAHSGVSLCVHTVKGMKLMESTVPLENVQGLRFSDDGERIALWAGNQAALIATKTGQQLAPLAVGRGTLADATFVANDRIRLVGFDGSNLILRDFDGASTPQVIDTGPSPIVSAAISRDATIVATALADRTIQLWDASNGADRVGQKLTGHVDKVAHIVFSPDGRRLASAGMGYDHTIRIWDTTGGQELLVLSSKSGDKPRLAFSDDGHWLAICRDRAEFWDFRPLTPETQRERHTLSVANHYHNQPLPTEGAVKSLNLDRSVDRDIRASSIELLSLWAEDESRWERAAWQCVRSPFSSDHEYRSALDWVNRAPVLGLKQGFVLKGAALYRNGRYEEANQLLAKERDLEPNSHWDRVRRVFLALTACQIGQINEANKLRSELDRPPTPLGCRFLIAELREKLQSQAASSR